MAQHLERHRCQAKRSIRGHQGMVHARTGGTIEAEIDNLDRHMLSVRWDNGVAMYVFPEEIEVEESSRRMA